MAKILLIIFCSFHAQLCLAQQRELDSLLNELKKHPRQDTVRLNLLNAIAFNHSFIDSAKSIEVANEIIMLAQKLNSNLKLAAGYMLKGKCYNNMRQDTAAIDMYNKAMKIYEPLNYKKGMGSVYRSIGLTYSSHSDYYTALEYEQKALTLFKELDNKTDMANSIT